MIKTFETERLILRGIEKSDAESYHQGFVDYDVIRHMNGNVPWPYPEDGVLSFLEKEVFPYQGKTLWQWVILLKQNPQKIIGSIVMRQSNVDNRGFWLAKSYWGQGYMMEALAPLTDYAFDQLGFTLLHFTNAKGNIRSRRIKEKQGARLVKVEPMEAVDDIYSEAEHWELTKEEWQLSQSSS